MRTLDDFFLLVDDEGFAPDFAEVAGVFDAALRCLWVLVLGTDDFCAGESLDELCRALAGIEAHDRISAQTAASRALRIPVRDTVISS